MKATNNVTKTKSTATKTKNTTAKVTNKGSNISIIDFVKEKVPYLFNSGNEKYIKWIEQPLYMKVYNEVVEHTSAINFILNNLIIDGIEEIDYWNLQKIALDYLIYGGFTVEVQKLRNGKSKFNYIDIGKCRLSPEKKKLGYSDNWEIYKVDIKWKNITSNKYSDGIYYFKNNKSRNDYPTPSYFSALSSLDTMSLISEYHNNNAKGGFTPNVVVNFNNGEPDAETKKEIEQKITDKFTGASGQKFILSFNETEETKTTIEKLENDNLDQRFESLQKFIQNQIIISHQITSGQLIGVKAENQGFSQTEYYAAMQIFEDVVISSFRKELEYGLSKLLDRDVELEQKEMTIPDPDAPKETTPSNEPLEEKNNTEE